MLFLSFGEPVSGFRDWAFGSLSRRLEVSVFASPSVSGVTAGIADGGDDGAVAREEGSEGVMPLSVHQQLICLHCPYSSPPSLG